MPAMNLTRPLPVWLSLAIVFTFWAAIYLPGLGTLELKGEEGRRILPAVTMLQTGNYVVPYVGSDPYFTKPPLVNWLVAGSFKAFGVRNEWAARLPSTLCVLAVALAFVLIARAGLGAHGSLAGALIWMTNFGIIEKGRLIEIEALYASLTGLAFICWLSWWQERRSSWLTWTVPWIFLGLGMLAKGPLHLVFFYLIVVAVLYRERQLRAFLSPAHFVGIALMLTIFAAWAIPSLQMMPAESVTETWARQFSARLDGHDFNLAGWLMNMPRALAYFLPWTILLGWAAVRRLSFGDEGAVRIATGLAWGIGISFVGVSVLPGALARYTMPLIAPAAWLVALLLATERYQMPRWLSKPTGWPRALRLPVALAFAAVLAITVYAFVVMPLRLKREKIRPIAREMNAALAAAEALYAVDPDFQPALFYVRDPIVYLPRIGDVPPDARYLLVQPQQEQEATASRQWQPRSARPILRVTDYRGKEVILLEVREAN
jgi:4-amino-4-deoxy-L-arabinose transferase-like glycosyltransferase